MLADATQLSILVDGYGGYGNFNNVRRLVRKLFERHVTGVWMRTSSVPRPIPSSAAKDGDPAAAAGAAHGRDGEMDVQCALDCRSLLGEGPVWDVGEQRLYWVDIKRRQIHRFAPDTGADETWPMPEDIGALAPREGGGLVVALKSGFYFYHLIDRRLVPAALPKDEPEHNRFNDGKADRQGRFWAGTMDEGEKLPTGGLFRLQANLACHKMIDGIICSNALCWSPDSRVMYFADSGQRTVWAWNFDPATGEIDNRRKDILGEAGIGRRVAGDEDGSSLAIGEPEFPPHESDCRQDETGQERGQVSGQPGARMGQDRDREAQTRGNEQEDEAVAEQRPTLPFDVHDSSGP